MPAKRAILLCKTPDASPFYRYVLWADVPALNQIAYRKPTATSAYENATPTELQAIRDGLVTEKVGQTEITGTAASVQPWLEAEWALFQAKISAEAAWSEYGRYWNGTAWVASAGVPMVVSGLDADELPCFVALTPVSAYAVNKFQFVLHNGIGLTVGQSFVVKVRLVVILPGLAAVTGAAPTVWTLRRRQAPTTPPSGTGGVAIVSTDSAFQLPAGVAAWNGPGVAPAGGTLATFSEFVPQADEFKLSTADAPTLTAAFSGWGGQVVYKASDVWPARPLTLRAGETLEIQQSGTAGTGNCRVLCLFTT